MPLLFSQTPSIRNFNPYQPTFTSKFMTIILVMSTRFS